MYQISRQFAGLVGAAGGVSLIGRREGNSNQIASSAAPRKYGLGNGQFLASAAQCEARYQEDDDEGKDGSGFVGVFLDAPSIEKVKRLGGLPTRQPHALVHLHPDPDQKKSFAPLFGSKAKVYVRGIAEDNATKQKVMIVEVSVGNGSQAVTKLWSKPYVPTIAFASEGWGDDVSDILGGDLARRLRANGILQVRGCWDGVLPAEILDGIKYPATRASFTEIEPLALEGTVCASSDYDKHVSQCVAAKPHKVEAPKQMIVHDEAAAVEEQEGEGEVGECPLCTYMLNSPCKEVFVVFKDCLDRAGASNEQGDLKRCEASANEVHLCIKRYRLFEEMQEAEEDDDVAQEGEEGEVKSTPSVQAASPAKR